MFKKITASIFTKIFLVSLIGAIIIIAFIATLAYWIFLEFREFSIFSIFFSDNLIFNNAYIIVLIILLIALFLASCYFVIRHILKPLSSIHQGVMELSKGKLDFQIKYRSNDELGEIIHSFNQMSKKLSNLIESKKQLLLNLSHEIKTPITRAKLSLEFFKKNKHTQNIQEDLKEIELMVNSILESEKLEQSAYLAKREAIRLDLLMQKIIQYHRKANIAIEYKNTFPVKKYNFDFSSLKTLLNNLILNSTNYSQTKKPILIESHWIESENCLQISVQDFGIGIIKNEQAKIFEPFYRIEKSRSKKYGGYGLGLSLCKKIVESYGGQISIQSSLHKGTKITATFPKAVISD